MPTQRVHEFDTWRQGYASSIVTVYVGGTTSKASIFSDLALTTALSNPLTLDSRTIAGETYGKFTTAVYLSGTYELDIDSTDQTGQESAPILTLTREDAGGATAITTGGTVARTLSVHFDDMIWAEDYGAIDDTDTSTNTTTITAAIGEAAARGGGVVNLPKGDIPVTSLSLAADIRLRGAGRSVTTLESQLGGDVITLTGDRAGLMDMTLDGIDLQASSRGVYAVGRAEIVMTDVIIKRFDVGLHFKGLQRAQFRDFYVDGCATNIKLHGDLDTGGASGGSVCAHNRWIGGGITGGTTRGLDLSYEDLEAHNNVLEDVDITGNADAVRINGARFTKIAGWWATNTTNLNVLDDTASGSVKNKVEGLLIEGNLNGGTATFQDTCADIIFRACDIEDVDFTLTLPTNAILFEDCLEDSNVTFSGQSEKIIRRYTTHNGSVIGITTDNVATKAWSVALNPGEMAHLQARVLGNQKDGEQRLTYHISAAVHRPGSTLAYDGQTANFILGATLTGGTSAATAVIVKDVDAGTTGTLTLRTIDGVFQNNETITDGSGGAAVANGTLTTATAVVQDQTYIQQFRDDADWDAAFVASAGEIELQVTGDTSQTINWTVAVDMERYG